MSGAALLGDALAFLDRFESGLQALFRAYMLEQWSMYTRGEAGRLEQLQRQRAEIYREEATRDRIDRFRESLAGDLLHDRRLELHQLAFRSARVEAEEPILRLETSLTATHLRYRSQLYGRERTELDLLHILHHDTDRVRREQAWRARNALGVAMAPGLMQLVDRRNAAARRQGAASFYSFKLALAGIDETRLLALAHCLDEATRVPLMRCLDERSARLGVARLEPWDLSFDVTGLQGRLQPTFSASALMNTLRRVFAEMGFVLDRLPITIDSEERPKKSQHAYCFAIDAPRDVRVLCHVGAGPTAWHTLFHEFGHAVYSAHHDDRLPWPMKDAPAGCFHEAIAQLFGGLVYAPTFLRTHLQLPENLVAEALRERRNERILEVRWRLAMLRFERSLYSEPDGDPTALWWEAVERYVGLSLGKLGLHLKVPAWARIIHFATHPVYVQNYLLADLIAAQLHRALHRTVGGFLDSKEAGLWLIERVFRHGSSKAWESLLEEATGESLSPVYLCEELVV